jgi:hypothetical protein
MKPIAIKTEIKSFTPGPNVYDIQKATKLTCKANNVCACSAFKSSSKRDNLADTSELPAPNAYEIKDDLIYCSTSVPYSSFRSNTTRNMFAANKNFPG